MVMDLFYNNYRKYSYCLLIQSMVSVGSGLSLNRAYFYQFACLFFFFPSSDKIRKLARLPAFLFSYYF